MARDASNKWLVFYYNDKTVYVWVEGDRLFREEYGGVGDGKV